MLAEESTHKWTHEHDVPPEADAVSGAAPGGGYRGVFDTGLAVAMTPKLSLTVGLTYRYDSDPGVGFKKGDTLFVTGIALKID